MTCLIKIALAAASFAAISACETTPPPPPPEAVLSFAGTTTCTDDITNTAAVPVTIKKRQSTGLVTTKLDAAAACQSVEGARLPYALFKLPQSVEIASIQVGAVLERKRVFAAEVLTLDADLAPQRVFGRDSFLHRGGSWSAFFRPRENERYIAVRANPALIGDAYDFVIQPTVPASSESNESAPEMKPLRVKSDFSFEGLAFTRVFLHRPSEIGPNKQ